MVVIQRTFNRSKSVGPSDNLVCPFGLVAMLAMAAI